MSAIRSSVSRRPLLGGRHVPASAPSLAGVVALLNQHLGFQIRPGETRIGQHQPLRSAASPQVLQQHFFTDVATGDNAVRCALGTPNCVRRACVGYRRRSGLRSSHRPGFHRRLQPGSAQWNLGTAEHHYGRSPIQAKQAWTMPCASLPPSAAAAPAGVAPTGVVSFLAETRSISPRLVPPRFDPNGATSTATI